MRKSAVTFTKDTGIRINMPDGSARHYEVCECDTCSADDMRTCNGDVADNPSPITRNFLGFVRNFLGFVRN